MTQVGQDWSAAQYLKFEDERTRPARDLLDRIPVRHPRECIDLGCGPGNSTELLARCFPQASVEGMDSSPDMLAKARDRLPSLRFNEGDIARWKPEKTYDIIFSNAVLHWLPNHEHIFPRLVEAVTPGGCLAIQMPDNGDQPCHLAMREVAESSPWADRLSKAEDARAAIGTFEDYYRLFRQAGCDVDLWRTTYVHPLAGASAIVEWFKSTGLKPYTDPLSNAERSEFLARYEAKMAAAYPAQPDGKVLLRFPRLFIVASRTS